MLKAFCHTEYKQISYKKINPCIWKFKNLLLNNLTGQRINNNGNHGN